MSLADRASGDVARAVTGESPHSRLNTGLLWALVSYSLTFIEKAQEHLAAAICPQVSPSTECMACEIATTDMMVSCAHCQLWLVTCTRNKPNGSDPNRDPEVE